MENTIKNKMVEKPVIQREVVEEQKIDNSIFKKRGNSKTYKGWIIQKLKEARNQDNPEMVQIIYEFYKKYLEFETSEKVKISSWKGKSSLQIIKHPDKFIVITYQKQTPDSEPKEIRTEITRQEANEVLISIYKLNNGEPIPTKDIAEKTYGIGWKAVFSTRHQHIKLTKILELLEYKGITKYNRKGFTTVLKEHQTVI